MVYDGSLNDVIKLELDGFKSMINIDSNEHEIEKFLGALQADVVDKTDRLEYTVRKGGLETMEVLLDEGVFKIIITNATGIDEIFTITLSLKFTTPNDNIIKENFVTSLVIAPGNSGNSSRETDEGSKKNSDNACSMRDTLKDMGVADENIEETAQLLRTVESSELTVENVQSGLGISVTNE